MLCLAESLLNGYDLVDMSQKMIAWKNSEIWVASNRCFDIGNQTRKYIDILSKILQSGDTDCLNFLRYEADEYSNGNGSLMKILPLLWYVRDLELEEQFEKIWEVSALTHPHIISAISCFLYLRMADYIFQEKDKFDAYFFAIDDFFKLSQQRKDFEECDFSPFEKIFSKKIFQENEKNIQSTGFVVDTLEVALWAFLNTGNYEKAIIKCVQFGEDTDTTAAVCGGLAGMYYGYENIPESWRDAVLRKDEILVLVEKFSKKFCK